MYLPSALAVISGLAMTSMALPAIPNAASFQTFDDTACSPQAHEHQNIPSGVCSDLPDLGFELFYLAPGCRFVVYEGNIYQGTGCTGANVTYTAADFGQCKDISTKHSYEVFC